jgi:peptidoglycan-associated lipoprotein
MEPRRAVQTVLVAASLVLALGGCDMFPGFKSHAKVKTPEDAKSSASPAGQTTTTSATAPLGGNKAQSPAVFTKGLSVSDLIAQACGIKPQGPGRSVTPSFEFDSAALADADRQLLAEIAKCLTEGALKGHAVALVGRADARGEPEYNMTLGESRADAVQRYLIDLGVGKDKTRATSRGELDATGTNEEGWAQDRRVDIELVL